MKTKPIRFLGTLLLAAAGMTLSGCGKKAGGAAGGPPADFAALVIVAEARVQPVSNVLSLVGSVVPNEMVDLKSETDGAIEEILFEEGQRVKKGQKLFRLDDTKTAALLAEAEATLKLSKANLDRLRTLQQNGSSTRQELDQSLANFEMATASVALRQREMRDAHIVAPFDGVTGPRVISPGQVINKNANLGSLVSVDPVKVEFNVSERYLSLARIGQPIAITVTAWPGERFPGEVFFIAPKLESETRTALVKARLPNPDNKLKPGMFANLEVTLKVRDGAVVIPESALMLNEDRVSIFVVESNDTARLVPVKVGLRMPGLVEISEGIKGGERVIVEGTQKVRPGGKVRTPDDGKRGS